MTLTLRSFQIAALLVGTELAASASTPKHSGYVGSYILIALGFLAIAIARKRMT